MNQKPTLASDAVWVFDFVLKGVAGYSTLIKPMPNCRLAMSKKDKEIANIRQLPGSSNELMIKLSAVFLEDLRTTLYSHEEHIRNVFAYPISQREIVPSVPMEFVLDAVYDLSLQFIFHHELFHLLLGHCDLRGNTLNSFSISETAKLGQTSEKNPNIDFLLEYEADNTAVAWLYSVISLGSLDRVIDTTKLDDTSDSPTIRELKDDAKIVALRLLVIAIWLFLSMIEKRRAHKVGQTQIESHPIPELRIATCLLTLIQHFAQLVPREGNNAGYVSRVNETDIGLIDNFLVQVLGPIALHLRDFPDASGTKPKLDNLEDYNEENPALKIIQSVRDYLAQPSEANKLTRTMNKLEPIYKQLRSSLEPYRYIKEISL